MFFAWLANVASFPVYLFILVIFANRYVLGLYLKLMRGRRFDLSDNPWEPTVTIVVPLYNEGRSIYDTIKSLRTQRYPASKLEITIIDDSSTDDSLVWATQAARDFDNVTVLENPHNMGKRRGINRAVRQSRSEIIISVDSDVIADRNAVRRLVRRFVAPDIAAVGGGVHIVNANESWLSRLQTIKYYVGYRFLKNLERSLQSVMCLSGCLTAYRRSVLMELEPILENRNVLGVPITYGEDRFLTRQIVKHGYRTVLTLDAFCFTKAPTTLSGYFNQQLRWKRSNLIDFFCGLSHAWRLHPLVAVHYLSMLLLLMVYPFVIFLHLMNGELGQLTALHLGALGIFGFIYHFDPDVRRLGPEQRVHPIWFLPMAVLMPAAYLVLTPLALFTLHSSSWETRSTAAPTPHLLRPSRSRTSQ